MAWVLSVCVGLGLAGHGGLAAAVVVGLVVVAWWRRDPRAVAYALLAAACAAIGAGAARRQADDARTVAVAAAHAGDARLELRGRVADFPRTSPYGTSFAFATNVGGRPVRILVRASFFDVSYGDRYALFARLSTVPSPSRASFDARGLCGLARVGLRDARRLDGGAGCPFRRKILWPLHRAARVHLTRAMGARAALANGVLLGERGQLDRRVDAAFRRLGVTHLIAISGMHLSAVAACALAIARVVPRWSGACVLLAVSLYTGVVGEVDSLTRSFAMLLLLFTAHALVRPSRPIDALGKALCLMLLASPLSIRSVGLQLSLAATFAVLVVLPHLATHGDPSATWRRRTLVSLRSALTGAFLVSAAVEVFIAPLQIHHFGAVSVVGPLATVLFFAPVSAVLLGSFATASLAGVPGLAQALEWVSESTCRMALAAAHAVPAPLEAPAPNVLLYYGGVVLVWTARRRWWVWPLGMALVASSFLFPAR